MVTTELLRRYPFFSFMTHDQLREVAMIAREITLPQGEVLFRMGDQAGALYFLLSGSIDLHYIVVDENLPHLRKDFMVGTINPGEVLGISAIIGTGPMTATALATTDCTLMEIDATELEALVASDQQLAYGLIRQIAKTTMERLQSTRILLAAATTPVV